MVNIVTKFKLKLGHVLYDKKLLLINIVILAAIKTAFPVIGLQFANFSAQLPLFDSEAVITETNKIRTAHNLASLSSNSKLNAAALGKMNDMIAGNYFAHISPDGIKPWFWIDKNGYNYAYAGENLALGFFTAQETINAWANSPSHRINLLNKNYTEIGVATGKATINSIEGILVVQIFGKPNQLPSKLTALAPISKTATVESPPSNILTDNIIADPETEDHPPQTELRQKEEPVTLQYVSTDKTISPVVSPKESSVALNSTLTSNLLLAYQIYISLFLAIITAVIIFKGLNKKVFIAATANLLLFIASIVTPSSVVTAKVLIF